jgi:hypothetical protein
MFWEMSVKTVLKTFGIIRQLVASGLSYFGKSLFLAAKDAVGCIVFRPGIWDINSNQGL